MLAKLQRSEIGLGGLGALDSEDGVMIIPS